MEPDETHVDKEQSNSPANSEINEPNTLIETLEELKEKGYTYDFNLTAHALELHKDDGVTLSFSPEDFSIVDVCRFEGMSNPSDGSVLYVIESKDGLKGTLVSSYGIYADAMSNEMIKKLDTRNSIIGFNSDDMAH